MTRTEFQNAITAFALTFALFLGFGCVPVKPRPGPDTDTNKPAVLMFYESSNPGSREQLGVMYSEQFRKWLEDTTSDWRMLDKDTNMANAPREWQDRMTAARTLNPALPALVTFRGGKAVAHAMPNSIEAAKKVVVGK